MVAKIAALPADRLLSEWSGLKEFLEEFVRDLPPALAWFVQVYVGGQLTARPRKTVRRLASMIGVSEAYLQRLLRDRRWDEERLRSILSSHVQRMHGKHLRGLLFEQTLQKSGKKSLRSLRVTNLVLAEREFCCILDSDPDLSPSPLLDDCRWPPTSPAPERMRSKLKGAVDLVDRARRDGIRFDWLLVGRIDGAEIALLQSLAELGQRFIAEVPETLRGWLYHPLVATAGHLHPETCESSGSSGPPSRPPRPIKELTAGLLHWEDTPGDGGRVPARGKPWRARILSLYAESHGLPTDPLGLLVLHHRSSGQRRYFLSNGCLGVSLRSLTEIALSKDKIEDACRQVADQVGLADFQPRNSAALRRHLALSTLSMLFRAERTEASLALHPSPKGSA